MGGDWSEWTDCSATCDDGYQSRSRVVAQEANSCGKPLEGARTEYKVCPNGPCVVDNDCKLADWGSWSDCSCSCFGIMERPRNIYQQVSGDGKACDNALKEIASCNPSKWENASAAC